MKTKQRSKIKQQAKKVFIPHKANQYRPHLIRAHGIIAVLVVALLAQVVYSFASTGHASVLGSVSSIQAADLLADTNQARERQGLPDLSLNTQLSQAAFLKAQDMFKNNYWAHVSPTGVQPWKWFADVGYNYSYAGENLAKNYPSAQATVDAWMNSPEHRANILDTHYFDVGFAVVDGQLQGQSTTLVVALYGAPVTAAAVQGVSSVGSSFMAPTVGSGAATPWGYVANALLLLSPVTIAVLGLFVLVAMVGLVAHQYRRQLPKSWQKSWRLHHGLYAFIGMLVLGVAVILATGSGSI
ncbi:MAG TPA: CAP domain-containing protein [Dongiaceae bacterium]|nr:CAP domain-containing protein [Dongiaceae bacterium]